MLDKEPLIYVRHSAYVIENEFGKVTDLTAYLSDWSAGTGRIYPFEY